MLEMNPNEKNVAPFLLRFRHKLPQINPEQYEDFQYSAERQVNLTESGAVAWRAGGRSSKPYTSASTASHTIPSGYTPSGKYKPAKFVPSKMDKRSGK